MRVKAGPLSVKVGLFPNKAAPRGRHRVGRTGHESGSIIRGGDKEGRCLLRLLRFKGVEACPREIGER